MTGARGLLLAAFVAPFACAPIEGTELSRAPLNVCPENPCERFASGGRPARAACSNGRCEFAGRPDFPFGIVVTVPSTSFYAPGQTFFLTSEELFRSPSVVDGPCRPPGCLRLPRLGQAIGTYRFTDGAASALGLPVPGGVSIPVRVTFIPLVGATGSVEAHATGLPLDHLFGSSRWQPRAFGSAADVVYAQPLPAGRYLRLSYPEPPYDAYLPPAIDEVRVVEQLNDDLILDVSADGAPGTVPLDDPSGDSRLTEVRRTEGLDGWRVWLADTQTGRRISTIRALSGVRTETLLATTRQSAEGATALRDGVDVVVAPPEDWIAVPRLQSTLLGGQGLRPLEVPPLPLPASIAGVVGEKRGDGTLNGFPARLHFRSTQLRQRDGATSQLLRYEATVATDDVGRFATVLPLGSYDVTVEPAEGTGFGKLTRPLDVSGEVAPTFEPPRKTSAVGRAVLGDGRPLVDALVLATPSRAGDEPLSSVPRPARARTTADGRFALELDQGAYEISVIPQEGSGFPRVVVLTSVGGERAELPVIEVPPPTRLSFTVKDPSSIGIPITQAIVRIFAEPPGGGPSVEIGRAVTDGKGACEILLAQQPR